MAREWLGKWSAGRVRVGRGGKVIWAVECMRGGVTYTISLPVTGKPEGTDAEGFLIPPEAVRGEFALFERDPAAYKRALVEKKRSDRAPAGDRPGDGPCFRGHLIIQFWNDRVNGLDGGRPVTQKHAKDTGRYLKGWLKTSLNGRDLRTVTLAEYQDALRTLKPRRHHVRALRAFTHWLRRMGKLESSQDASRDLEIPQPKKGAKRAAKNVVPDMPRFEKLYAALKARPQGQRGVVHHSRETWAEAVELQRKGATVAEVIAKYDISEATFFYWKKRLQEPVRMSPAQAVRDVLVLRALCGVHHTEVERIAVGTHKVRKVEGQGEIVGTVAFIHEKKDGLEHPISLCAKAYAAAKRLQELGKAPDDATVARLMDEAAELAGVPRMDPSDLRHCFITWARTYGREVRPKNAGVSRETIARIVGHTSVSTTLNYDGTEVPEMIALPLQLENDEDPVELGVARQAGVG
jgi:integrase